MGGLAKRLAVLVIACAAGLALLELGARWVYQATRGQAFSRDEVRARLLTDRVDGEVDAVLADVPMDAAVPDQPVILHPYFGYVINPEKEGVNVHGFFHRNPLTKRSPDKLIVAIFGGSVADQVYYLGGGALVRALQERAEYRDKEIDIVSLAVGGYKQPQQLLILSYLFALGAEYDVVINVDGFNEFDSAQDNVMTGIYPYFPHTWKLHGRRGLDIAASTALGRVEILREERRRLRERFATPLLSRSAFGLVLWDFLDAAREAEIRERSRQLEEHLDEAEAPVHIEGPPFAYTSDEEMYREMAAHWRRSSAAMDRLCSLNGATYLHFLQPNQYVPGSKPLTEEEVEVAIDPDFHGVYRVPLAYPIFREEGRRLRDELGVEFFDLTELYADETRTVYNDFCCHVNQLGADLMAEAIAARVP